MKTLPLYQDTRAIIEKVQPIADLDSTCTRCRLNAGVRTVCMPADAVDRGQGFTGAVLVLGDFPTDAEDDARRPVSAGPNSMLREIVEQATSQSIVYATALRCAPKSRNVTDRMVDACRPYTAGLIEEIKPSRIVCLGKRAYQAVLGSTCDSVQLGRRGYGYLSDGTPVYMLHPARRVTPNRFLLERWKKDLEWALTGLLPDLPPWDGEILEIETPYDARLAADDLRGAGSFAYDTETAGQAGSAYFEVLCLTATPMNNTARSYLWTPEALKNPATCDPLREVLADASVGKIGHNLKFDFEAVAHGLRLLDARGVLQVRGAAFDTMLTVRTIDTESKAALDHADHHVGMGGHKNENLQALDAARQAITRARANPKQARLPGATRPALAAAVHYPGVDVDAFAYGLVPRPILERYCALDTVATARLAAKYQPIVAKSESLSRVRDVLHLPVTEAVAQIESWGMSADAAAARAFGRMLEPRRDAALANLRALGCTVDVQSPKQLAEYLFNDLGLPVQEITDKGSARVNAASLEKLRNRHEVIPHLLEHAKITKLLSTYVTGLIPHIRDDGRIRTSLNIAGARSGRMSSSNPNLQNIPSSGEFAKMAKVIFNAPPGHVLLQLDYSQLEVRIAAALSSEPGLIQAYLDGADVHRRTASKAFGLPESDVTKEQRRSAKTVVFGVLYGKTPSSLSKDLGVDYARAQFIYDSVLGAFPTLTRWMEECRRHTLKNGTAWTYLTLPDLEKARCRQLWQIAEPDGKQQSVARNGAVNTPIQGTASDFMLRTLVAVVQWIVGDGVPARVVNTVHDSIILEVPDEWALEVAGNVKAIMESWPANGVPLVADVDIGTTWGTLYPLQAVTLCAAARRDGLTDDETLHLLSGDKDIADAMGDDQVAWLEKLDALTRRVQA